MNKAFEIALTQYGIREYSGTRHNPEVVKYFTETGHKIYDDNTSWCSAFMNWCHFKAGIPYPNKLNARSWLEWGEIVLEPQVGDVVVFWRVEPRGWQGHVGFFIRKEDTRIWVLGGNQSDHVCIDDYSETQLLGYRRL